MNRQRKIVITITYNEMGIIIDTKAEELDLSAQPEQAVKDCRNCKHGKYNDYHDTYFCYNAEGCSNWDKWETSEQPDGISLEWIDKHLEWLDNCDNDFAQLAKVGIRAMVETWKKEKI